MKFGIVTFPGSNCDYDAYQAVTEALSESAVNLWHKDTNLKGVDVVILPGGFSYGDYLRAGAIARFSPIMNEVAAHARAGRPVLAICNGFQVACEAGMLPGALLRNTSLRFISRLANVRVENSEARFTGCYAAGDVLQLPVAHGEGRFTAQRDVLAQLEDAGRVVFRYCDSAGRVGGEENLNGSANSIAGILNAAGNVLGMMPHPERAVDPLLGPAHGAALFRSLLAKVAA